MQYPGHVWLVILTLIYTTAAMHLLPSEDLPLKTHMFADGACEHQAHLYYLPDGFCIGPLYAPVSSVRLINAVPANCSLTAYDDGHCQGSTVSVHSADGSLTPPPIRGRVAQPASTQAILGPTAWSSCYGVGELQHAGANSFFLRCGDP